MIRFIFPLFLTMLVILMAALIFALPTPDGTSNAAANSSAQQQATDSDTGQLPEVLSTASELVIANVLLVVGGELRQLQSVHIKDGHIQAVGADLLVGEDVPTFDATGLTAIPGLIDSHTHSWGSALEDALRFGVTTQLDMNSAPAMLPEARAARASTQATSKADLFSAGMLATADGGHGTQFGLPMQTLSGPQEAVSWVAERKAEGSDFIKLVYIPGQDRLPSIDRRTAKAVIDAAHAQNMLALAHISTQAAALDMINDGIDGLVHIFADSAATDELIQAARSSDVFVIPTLTVIASVDGKGLAQQLLDDEQISPLLSSTQSQTLAQQFGQDIPGFSLTLALQNVERLHTAGVPILAGSDAPNPGTAHGASVHQELELLVQAGLSTAEALAAATTAPARIFSLTGRGELTAGSRADLVLLDHNPVNDIKATRAINQVVKNGRFLMRTSGKSLSAERFDGVELGHFDDDTLWHGDFEWSATTDVRAGGQSEAVLSMIEPGANGSAGALQVDAEIKPGFPYPWAGAAVTPRAGEKPRNVAHFKQVSFYIKGTPGYYRLMVFSGDGNGIPPTQTFQITEQWQQIALPLENFAGFDPHRFIGFAFVAGAGSGKSSFILDRIQFEE